MGEMKYCTNCGTQIDKKAEFCYKCGVRQIYNVQTTKGIIFFLTIIVIIVLSIIIISAHSGTNRYFIY